MSSAAGVVLLSALYAVVLSAGLLSLPSPDVPIGDPYFTLLEILILLSAPLMVVLMVAVHAWTPPEHKVWSLAAVVFMSLMAVVTCGIHFSILSVGRAIGSAGGPWLPLLLSFQWPSIAYALDILAWDVFFGFSVLFAAPIFRGDRLEDWIRALLVASGLLSLAGLSGVFAGDMRLRMIGVVGYSGVFPVAALLLAILFRRTSPPATSRR